MTDRVESMECPLCCGTRLSEVFETGDPRYPSLRKFRIMWCTRCEVASTVPRLSIDDLQAHYPDDYDPYVGDARDRAHSRLHRLLLSAEERFSPGATDPVRPGALLDVGCGTGQYMSLMARRGFHVMGVDFSARAAELVRRRGLPVVVGDFLRVPLPQGAFDVVTMNHYLEHSLDPRASLERARYLLRPQGRLIVGVPNFESWTRRRFGPNWSDLEVPRHVFHFTPPGLVRLLEACGFRVERVRHQLSPESGSIATSFLVKAKKRNHPLGARVFPFLHAACYPVGIPLSLLRRSAWIRVFAARN